MKPLFKTTHSTIYTGKEEIPIFDEKALNAARNIQPDKRGLKKLFKTMRKDKFARKLQKVLK